MINKGFFGPTKEKCFFCGETLSIPHVSWLGHSSKGPKAIALHSECAKNLALHLGKDALNCEYDKEKLKNGFICKICWEIKPFKEHSHINELDICKNCIDMLHKNSILWV